MRVLVIGATGHVGSYLVPVLVRSGYDVVAMSRGKQQPYRADEAWASVERRQVDRDAEDAAGTFVDTVLDVEPDAVIDMVCFEPSSARASCGRARRPRRSAADVRDDLGARPDGGRADP